MIPRLAMTVVACLAVLLAWGCGQSSTADLPSPASLLTRATRRAYTGAPPTIPHPPLTGTCASCHTPTGGRIVPGIGVAPANPHTQTPGLSEQARCRQCHVFRQTEEMFVVSEFVPFRADGRRGERSLPQAPPTVPHTHFLREDCRACHVGGGARPEIVCQHADRTRCQQCHVNTSEPVSDEPLLTTMSPPAAADDESVRDQKPQVTIR